MGLSDPAESALSSLLWGRLASVEASPQVLNARDDECSQAGASWGKLKMSAVLKGLVESCAELLIIVHNLIEHMMIKFTDKSIIYI